MGRLVRFISVSSIALTIFVSGAAQAAPLPGDLIVTDFNAFGGNGGVLVVNPVGGAQVMLSSGGFFRDPWGIAVDITGPPRIFVSDIVADAIIEVDPGTGGQLLVSSGGLITNPTGVEESFGTDLYVTDTGTNALIKVDKNTGLQTLVFSGPPFVSPFDVAVNKYGDVYVIDRVAGGGTVFQMVAGVPVPIASGAPFVQPYGITIDQGQPLFPANEPGGLWVVDRNAAGGPGAVIFVDANTGTKTVESRLQLFSDPSGIAIGPGTSGSPFYTSDYLTKRIVQFDPSLPDNANQVLISSAGLFVNPAKVAVFPEQPVQTKSTTWGRVKGQYR